MKKQLVLSFILFFTLCHAQIIEHDSIAIVHDFLHPDIKKHKTLIIFDIDNTLAETPTQFGGDQWFYGMSNHYAQTKNMPIADAYNYVFSYYEQIQHDIPLVPTETITAQTITNLQAEGFPVIALTARSLSLIDRTIDQLNTIEIDFSQSEHCHHDFGGTIADEYQFKHGIIFCGNNNKGTVLFEVLKTINYLPSTIIFVDDKHKNLVAVETEIDKHNDMEFFGIRYNRCDEKVAAFDPVDGERYLQEFLATSII